MITTKGWVTQVEWTDGTWSWLPLKDVNAVDFFKLAEYIVSRKIQNEPAFAWWVSNTFRTRKRIISRLKSAIISKGSKKFGIQVPSTIVEAEKMDVLNGHNFWRKAIEKELAKVRIAFKLVNTKTDIKVGSKKIGYYFIFDVKMDLERKTRLVAGGHLNKNVPKRTSYSSAVSRESVRICFTLAVLKDQKILSGDVSNAYLNAKPL